MYIKWESIEKYGMYGPPTPAYLKAGNMNIFLHTDMTQENEFFSQERQRPTCST